MKVVDVIKCFATGAFAGSFIGLLVAVLIAFQIGPETVKFTGTDIVNLFFGSIVAGGGFSFSGLIYEKEDLPLPVQVLFQMVVGLTVLFLIAVYLKWMPVTLGIWPIISWILIACVFAAVFWLGFYIYYCLVARDLNKKIADR